MRLAMIVEYDGTDYSGFQFQKNAPSVQQQIEKAIRAITSEAIRVKPAGRTDAGVHARGQVVSFDTGSHHPPDVLRRALNARLPEDIVVRALYRVGPDFDPRRHAISRVYRYCLLVSEVWAPLARRRTHRVNGPLDLDTMRQAAEVMVGVHDFANFGGPIDRPGASTVRRIDRIDIETEGCRVRVDVEGSAFLPHQVRRMVGALVDVGRGRLNIEQVRRQISGAEDAPPARSLPPQGLCLVAVRYKGFPPRQDE